MSKMVKVNNFKQVNFFLGGRTQVNTLEEGAKLYGGATIINNIPYSNIEAADDLQINDKNNTLSLYIPSTIDVNNNIDNTTYVNKYNNIIKKYFNADTTIEKTEGGWFSEDNNIVVIEKITIINVNIKNIDENKINFMLNLGLMVKHEMQQEGVSVTLNNSLMIV